MKNILTLLVISITMLSNLFAYGCDVQMFPDRTNSELTKDNYFKLNLYSFNPNTGTPIYVKSIGGLNMMSNLITAPYEDLIDQSGNVYGIEVCDNWLGENDYTNCLSAGLLTGFSIRDNVALIYTNSKDNKYLYSAITLDTFVPRKNIYPGDSVNILTSVEGQSSGYIFKGLVESGPGNQLTLDIQQGQYNILPGALIVDKNGCFGGGYGYFPDNGIILSDQMISTTLDIIYEGLGYFSVTLR